MTTPFRFLVFVIIALAVAALWTTRQSDSPARKTGLEKIEGEATSESSSDQETSENRNTGRTKTKIRNPSYKPTIEETERTFKTAIIPFLDLPEQTLEERIAALNQISRELGISPDKLTFVIEENDHLRERPISGLMTEPIRLRDVSLFQAVRVFTGSTIHWCRIQPSRVEFWNLAAMPESETQGVGNRIGRGQADPFAESR